MIAARRFVAGSAAAALALGLAATVAAPAHAADPTPCPQLSNTSLAPGEADFDGDGSGDVAYGLPNIGVGTGGSGGSVVVTTAAGTSRLTVTSVGGGTSAGGDQFGAVVRAERIDADACTDLVISAPGINAGAGRVYIVFGATTGLGTGRPTYVLSAPKPAPGERFGQALDTSSTYNYYGSAYATLAVGAPGTTVAQRTNAGAVHRYSIIGGISGPPQNANEFTLSRTWTWTQGAKGVNSAEKDDRFGQVVDVLNSAGGPDVVVGVPLEDIGRAKDAGVVDIRTAYADKVVELSQLPKSTPGTPATGNRFGASVIQDGTTMAVGIPGQKIGNKKGAGAIQLFSQNRWRTGGRPIAGSYKAGRTLTLTTANVSGDPTAYDGLGTNLALLHGIKTDGALTLFAGMPHRTIGRVVQAGGLARFDLTSKSCPKKAPVCGGVINQSTPGIPGTAVAYGHFGTSLGILGDYTANTNGERRDTVIVGAPGTKVGSALGAYVVWGPNGNYAFANPDGTHTGEGFGSLAPARYTGFSFYHQ